MIEMSGNSTFFKNLPSLENIYESPQPDENISDDEGIGEGDGENNRRLSSNKGRQLYCRKCLGHNINVMLKGHTAVCPYISCECKSCLRLMRMRKSAFIRRYRSALGTADLDKLNVVSYTLLPNTNTRFVLQASLDEQTSDDSPSAKNQICFFRETESSSPPDLVTVDTVKDSCNSNSSPKGFNNSDTAATNTGTDANLSLSPSQCNKINRDRISLSVDVTDVRDAMSPTSDNNASEAVIAGQISPTKNQPSAEQLVRSILPGASNMISELPAAQRELLGVFQNTALTNQSAEALQAQHLLYLQQQHALQANRFAAGGNISPPRAPPPLQMNPTSQQMASMRGKRPAQIDQGFSTEPVHKRSLGNFPPSGLPLNLPQMNGLNPQQQLALIHMHQQGLSSSTGMPMQGIPPVRPTVAQQPPRMPYNPPGFVPPFNPQNNAVSNEEVLQNYIQLIRNASAPIPRPALSESQQMANLVALMNSNQQRTTLEDHIRRQKDLLAPMPSLDHPVMHVGPPVRHEDPSRVIRAPVHIHQQSQHHLLQVQNEQRRRSLSGAIPTMSQNPYNIQLAVAQAAAVQAAASAASAVQNPQAAPPRLSPAATLPKTPSSAYLLSPSTIQRSTPSSITSNNATMGPEDVRYQQFLRAVELFNRGVVDDETTMIQHFDIPSPVVRAANATFRANIPVPLPLGSFELTKKKTSMTFNEPNISTAEVPKPNHAPFEQKESSEK